MKLKPALLRAYISRGKLKESQKGFINVYNPINQEWIVDYCHKNGIDYVPIFDQSKTTSLPNRKPKEVVIPYDIEEKVQEAEKEEQSEDLEKVISNTKLKETKLKKEIKKLEVETRLKYLELEKKKARVIPTDFSIEMTQRYLLGTVGGVVNGGNILIEQICDELGATTEQKLNYKKQLKNIINDTIKSKHEPASKEIIEYAKEYALMIKW